VSEPEPPGWYPNPDGSDDERYWDGHAWTTQRHAAPVSSCMSCSVLLVIRSQAVRISFSVLKYALSQDHSASWSECCYSDSSRSTRHLSR
jgi:Protein of unknown function (DUF2510)